jgi:hypothetical protein
MRPSRCLRPASSASSSLLCTIALSATFTIDSTTFTRAFSCASVKSRFELAPMMKDSGRVGMSRYMMKESGRVGMSRYMMKESGRVGMSR